MTGGLSVNGIIQTNNKLSFSTDDSVYIAGPPIVPTELRIYSYIYPLALTSYNKDIIFNAGAYGGGAQNFIFKQDGTDVITINSSGRVGIGSISPQTKLHISATVGDPSASAYTGGLWIGDTIGYSNSGFEIGSAASSPYGVWMQTKVANAGAGTYPLSLQPIGGNVGIGTTSPSSKLHVDGVDPIITFGNYTMDATNNVRGFAFTPYNDGNVYFDTKTYSGGSTQFRTGEGIETGYARTWMTVDSTNGNVGIGTTSPTAKLEVYGGDIWSTTFNPNYYLKVNKNIDSVDSINFIGPFATTFLQYDHDIGAEAGAHGTTIGASDGRVIMNGNVGIGTTSPANKLDVVGNISTIGSILIGTTSSYYAGISKLAITPANYPTHNYAGIGQTINYNRESNYQQAVSNVALNDMTGDDTTLTWDAVGGVYTAGHYYGNGTSDRLTALEADVYVRNNGRVANLYGMNINAPFQWTSDNRGTIGNLYGISVQPSGATGTNISIENNYGIYLRSPTVHNVDGMNITISGYDYSIFAPDTVQGAYFGGKVGIGNVPSTYPLEVLTNTSGISIYSQANISAAGYITRTDVFDTSKGKALDMIKSANDYKNPDGTINHDAFAYSKVSYDKQVIDKITYQNYTEVECNGVKIISARNETICNDIDIFDNETNSTVKKESCVIKEIPETTEKICGNVTKTREIPTYKVIQEEGVLLDKEVALLKQAIFELKEENIKLNERLNKLEGK